MAASTKGFRPVTPMDALWQPSFHRSWVEIDFAAIRENARRLKSLARPGVALCVKADAYGYGATEVASAVLAAYFFEPNSSMICSARVTMFGYKSSGTLGGPSLVTTMYRAHLLKSPSQ